MKKINKLSLVSIMLLSSSTLFAERRTALSVAGNLESRKWNVTQSTSLQVAPYSSSYSSGALELNKLGVGAALSWESVDAGFSLTGNLPIFYNMVQKATAGSTEVANFAQNEISASFFPEVNYKIGPIAPFAAVGYTTVYSFAASINGSPAVPRYSYLATGFSAGGGLKIFLGDHFFARGAYTYYFYEFGADLSAREVINNYTYSLDRKLQSSYNIMFSVGYIFNDVPGGAKDPYAAPAPTAADPYAAPAEEVKPAAVKKPAGKKKGK